MAYGQNTPSCDSLMSHGLKQESVCGVKEDGKGGTQGGTQLFFGGRVPCGFQNVGSREWIFFEKWGSWERKFGKVWVERARILAIT